MDAVQGYKCPCCGAGLVFSGEKQTLHCESCGNDFDTETMEQIFEAEKQTAAQSKFDWEHYEPRSFGEEEAAKLSGYTCPSCGAEITGDDTMGSAVCPYCGNAAIVKDRFEGAQRPDYIIPFKLDKKAAMQAFEEDFKNAPFLPDAFKNKKKIQEMEGVYVPFWMFDCDCNASISYRGEIVSHWSDSKYDYTKTDYYKLFRGGRIGFENIPVDGSKKADNDYTEALEPFDCSAAVNFNPAYLSGFLADRYDVSAEESIERANERVKTSVESEFLKTTDGYVGVVAENTNINFSNGKIRYSLLPIWMLNIKYMDNMYKFAVNGQTGKVVGVYPIDKKKKWKYFAKVAAVCYAVLGAIAYFLFK